MEADVFVYFVSIGAGAAVGVTIGALPGFALWRWIKKRDGGLSHVEQIKKARSRA